MIKDQNRRVWQVLDQQSIGLFTLTHRRFASMPLPNLGFQLLMLPTNGLFHGSKDEPGDKYKHPYQTADEGDCKGTQEVD